MTGVAAGWVVEHDRGPAQELLDRSAARLDAGPPVRTIRVIEVDRPAVVLGSGQAASDIDPAAAARAGVDVAKRRSGGGAVLLTPDDALWVDVVIPAGDPWWDADIGRATWPIGEAWAVAVEAVGSGLAVVWKGAMQHTEWSRRVCLAGLGPGEVLVGSRKVVGISQRRTRTGTLFQTVGVLRWAPAPLLGLFGLSGAALDAAAASLSGVAGLSSFGAEAGDGVSSGGLGLLRDALLGALMT